MVGFQTRHSFRIEWNVHLFVGSPGICFPERTQQSVQTIANGLQLDWQIVSILCSGVMGHYS